MKRKFKNEKFNKTKIMNIASIDIIDPSWKYVFNAKMKQNTRKEIE